MTQIKFNGPVYRGAPYPEFDAKRINESEFEDELRCKEMYASIHDDGTCEVIWIAQASDCSSDKWDKEVIRAFKANGAKPGTKIHVKFGIRNSGWMAIKNGECLVYELEI